MVTETKSPLLRKIVVEKICIKSKSTYLSNHILLVPVDFGHYERWAYIVEKMQFLYFEHLFDAMNLLDIIRKSTKPF